MEYKLNPKAPRTIAFFAPNKKKNKQTIYLLRGVTAHKSNNV